MHVQEDRTTRRIRKVRLDHGIKQQELARRKISLQWLLKISRAREVPVGYFMGVVEPLPEEDDLGPKERRFLRAFRRMSRDPRLQM